MVSETQWPSTDAIMHELSTDSEITFRKVLGSAEILPTIPTNFVLVGLPAYLQRQLQSVLNAAARLVFRLRRYDHITDALAVLHWLRVPQRIDFKIAVMAFRVLHGLAPPYLDQLVRVATCLVVALAAYVHQRHTS